MKDEVSENDAALVPIPRINGYSSQCDIGERIRTLTCGALYELINN